MRADIHLRQTTVSFARALLHLIIGTRATSFPLSPPASAPTHSAAPSETHRFVRRTVHKRYKGSRKRAAMGIRRLLTAWALLSLAAPLMAHGETSAIPEFQLSDTCPASFENQDGGCVLRNRYREYRSLRDAGVGGLKTGLPPLREGFTPQQIDLGRYLFFDPILSADGSVSCASCHDPAQGFADGRGQAIGIHGQVLPRSAPSLWNVGFLSTLLWDGSKTASRSKCRGRSTLPLRWAIRQRKS